VNADALWLSRASVLASTRPARAVFDIVDQLAAWLRLGSARRARLLSPLARAALAEQLKPVRAPQMQAVVDVSGGEQHRAPDDRGKVRS